MYVSKTHHACKNEPSTNALYPENDVRQEEHTMDTMAPSEGVRAQEDPAKSR